MTRRLTGVLLTLAIILSVFPCCVAHAAASYTTSGGSVVINAANVDYTSGSSWTQGYSKKSGTSSTNGDYLQATLGQSSQPSSGSKMSFEVTADEAGRYSLWVRADATSSNGATWFRIGEAMEYTRYDLYTGNSSWQWKKLYGGYYLNAGEKVTIRLWPKSDGHNIDEFIFTNKSTYVPSGKVTSASGISNVTLSADYGMPTITPPANTHPRVMFRSSDIEKIKNNINNPGTQNTNAKEYFEGLVADTSFSGTVSGTNSSSRYIENKIEAFAFYYALYGDTAKGNKAVSELINYLTSVQFDLTASDYTRHIGCAAFKASEVYDWCYDLLTTEQKNLIISCVEGIMTGMEMGYPNISTDGNIVGHNSEAQMLRDMLAFGIAVYDERPDIYNYVMGRIQSEMVPARNYYYQSHSMHQGSSYAFFRFYWDLWAEKLVLAMSGGETSLFDYDAMKEVGYYQIYNRRPDGRMFVQGDDSSLSWGSYNGHSYCTAFFAGTLFDDKYLKGEARNMRTVSSIDFSAQNYNDFRSVTSVLWLIMNNPATGFQNNRSSLPKSRYFGSPNGTILAKTGWDYTTSDATGNSTASAMMKIGERYASNHDHLDAGTFQLYYKGILASDSGVYDDYSSDHNANYAKRTVAHNALTIYDSSESFNVLDIGTANDGGQKWFGEPHTKSVWDNGNYDRGTVLDHEIAADNSYSYIKGDITKAYSSNKAERVVRSMSFLETGDETFPAIMVIYDQVKSKSTSQTKKFLIHTQVEPTISGTRTTVVDQRTVNNKTYNGRMVMNTLLPANASITKIGGSGNQFKVNNTNYAPSNSTDDKYEGGWGRVEVAPTDQNTSTEFLNVLAVSDGDVTQNVSSTLIEGTNLVGTKTLKNVVMFSKATTADGRISETGTFTVSGSETGLKFTVFGVMAGNWIVKRNGSIIGQYTAASDGGTIEFNGSAGTYELSRGALTDGPFSGSNVSTGYVTEIKGATGDDPWTRVHVGEGTSRSSVTMTAKSTVSEPTKIIEAYDTSDAGYDGVFVHTAFRLKSDAPFQMRIRKGGSNAQWINFASDGGVYVNNTAQNGTNMGVDWIPGTRQRYDILADVTSGIGYLYIDGVLAAKSFNLQTDGKWYGYAIYTNETWNSGNSVKWEHYGDATVAYTLFKDTNSHRVKFEEAVTYSGISDKLTADDDENLIFHDHRIHNYFVPQGNAAASYPESDSMVISVSSKDTVVPVSYMLSGFYHRSGIAGVGSDVNTIGSLIHISFDQTIEGGDRAQIRLQSGGTEYQGINFTKLSNKLTVGPDYNDYSLNTSLNKAWKEKARVDIIIDKPDAKAYYFVDRRQIAERDFVATGNEAVFDDLVYYLRGSNAGVRLENYDLKVYNSAKDLTELKNEILNRKYTVVFQGIPVDSEFKASHGDSASYYNSTTSGTDPDKTITIEVQKRYKNQRALIESGIDNPLSGTEWDGKVHFAHARIKIAVQRANSDEVRLRIMPLDSDWHKEGNSYKENTAFNLVYNDSYSTYGWTNNYKGTSYGVTENDQCHIYTSTDPSVMTTKSFEGRNVLRFSANDEPDYQTFDFIFDCEEGYIYCYIDGRLIATRTGAVTNFNKFYGYSVTSSADNYIPLGTKIWFRYDPTRPGETLYADSDDYTVRLEDVLIDAGLASNNGDPLQIMESNHIADYIFAGNTNSEETSTYERRDENGEAVSMTAEKVAAGSGEVAQLYGGFYTKNKDWPGYAQGKGIIHLSFDQKINAKMNDGVDTASDSYSFKLVKQGGTQLELLQLVPTGDNKMRIKLIDLDTNPSTYLDKSFNDTIHYDIILKGKHYTADPASDYVVADGYYFADGEYIGTYTLNRGTDEWWTPTQVSLISNNTANVTYSNYKIALYEYDKEIEELTADIKGNKVYWKPDGMGIIKDGDSFTVNVVPATVYGKVMNNEVKTIIAAYDSENRFIEVLHKDEYSPGSLTTEPASSSGVAKVRAFIWEMESVKPVSSVKEYTMP